MSIPLQQSASTAPSALDTIPRRVALRGYGIGLVAALAADLVGSWPPLNRLALLLSLLAVAACMGVISYVPWYVPWRHGTRALYLALHGTNLTLITGAMAVSGGWASPFAVAVPVAVVFAALTVDRRQAFSIAALGALVTTLPFLYMRGGQPAATLIMAATVYGGIVYLISFVMEGVRERERAVDDAALARAQLEQRAHGLVTLQRVSAIVGSHLSMGDAIDAIVKEVGHAFGHQLISVYLREGEVLVMQAQAGYETPYVEIPLDTGICGRVGRTGETAFVPDIRHDVSYRAAVAGVISELCVPLRDGEEVMGILNVESVGTPLTELDRELLDLFAAQVSVVLRNARLAGELRSRAERDPLTGLLNHRALMEEFDRVLAPNDARCAVLMLDVDNFKSFNDGHGHLAGDGILRRVATALRESGRENDVAGRYGGDEFAVVLPGAGRAAAEAVLMRIARSVREQPYLTRDGTAIPLVISGGLAVAPDDGATRQELLVVADAAMYAAKRSPRVPMAPLFPHVAGDRPGATPPSVLEGLAAAVDARDRHTGEGAADVTWLALLLADRLGLTPEQREALSVAGPLRDVGKLDP